MALTIVGAIASIGMLFGTIGYYLGVVRGVEQEKERAEIASLKAHSVDKESTDGI